MTHRLTINFPLEEFIVSQVAERRGIDNTPSERIITNLGHLASDLETIRIMLGNVPILITSGYRCPALNEAIGGIRNSAHMRGLAADFIAPKYGSPREICQLIASSHLLFDQLIWEGRWVHYAIPEPEEDVKREVLTAHFYPGKPTSYTRGIG